jgi:ferritin
MELISQKTIELLNYRVNQELNNSKKYEQMSSMYVHTIKYTATRIKIGTVIKPSADIILSM